MQAPIGLLSLGEGAWDCIQLGKLDPGPLAGAVVHVICLNFERSVGDCYL